MKKLLAGAALAAALGETYRRFLREPILTWGATADEAARRLPGDELLEDADGRRNTRDHDRRAAVGGLAVARPDGTAAARRRLHLRLDREPARPRHAQRRPDPPGVPATRGRRRSSDHGRASRDARRAASSPSACSPSRSEDGNWVWTFVLVEEDGDDPADQPQPDRACRALRSAPARDARDGARLARDGAEDAPRHQGAGRATRREPGRAGRAAARAGRGRRRDD